ncbi:MAG: FecR family protein [Candidatus Firestonebacteria bacterium]
MKKSIVMVLVSIFLLGVGYVVEADVAKKATVSFLKGSVKIQKKGEKTFTLAKLSDALTEGDRIETGESAKIELKLETGSIVRIGESTSIVLEEIKVDKNTMTETSTMKVLFGRIWMNVKKTVGKKQESRIVTPKVTAAVKGTTYRADVSVDGETNVNVYDGTVNVSKEGQEVILSKLEKLSSKDLTKNPFDEIDDEKDEWVRWNKSRDKLRVVIVWTETKGGQKATIPVSETSMIETFLNNYLFSVVDQSQLEKIRESEKLKSALKGNDAAAAMAGLEYGADLIIVGEATTDIYRGEEMAGMVSATSNLVARIVRTDTAQVLAAKRETDRKPDITADAAASTTLDNAAKKMSAYFIDEIVRKWKEETRKGAIYDILVTNVTFEKLNIIQQTLAAVADKNQVDKLYFVVNRALLNMSFIGDSATLAGKISTLEFKGFKVEVVGLTAYKVELEVK